MKKRMEEAREGGNGRGREGQKEEMEEANDTEDGG